MTVYVMIVAMVMLIQNVGPYDMVLITVCVITVAMVTLLRDFGPCGITFMTVCYNHCHGNAAKEFWALQDNIYNLVL
jgi:hypothetical protein